MEGSSPPSALGKVQECVDVDGDLAPATAESVLEPLVEEEVEVPQRLVPG